MLAYSSRDLQKGENGGEGGLFCAPLAESAALAAFAKPAASANPVRAGRPALQPEHGNVQQDTH